MLKAILERVFRLTKNLRFRFAPTLSSTMLCSFVWKMLAEGREDCACCSGSGYSASSSSNGA